MDLVDGSVAELRLAFIVRAVGDWKTLEGEIRQNSIFRPLNFVNAP